MRVIIKLASALLSISLLLFASIASADISLDKIVIHFDSTSPPVNNIAVTNNSDAVIKVEAKVIETLNPGQDSESEIKTRELSVAPKIFELQPHETRLTRVILRKKISDQEKMYRIRFFPDKPTRTTEQESGGMSVKIGVVVGMGVLILANPETPKPNLNFVRKDGKITFSNTGNITAQLQREPFCNKDRSACTPLIGKRIYPGSNWTMDVPNALKGKAFSQTILINNAFRTLNYPP
ncbi:MAG: hypothetical protein COB04_10885 [Gammaproteobacteria bacterium]|nr:MAG: hypothetical protein COB04_10885 [Gammaproteobacteria bacterium]